MVSVGILIYPRVEELDFVGHYEVLSYAEKTTPGSVQVLLVAPQESIVRGFNGMRVLPDVSFATCPPLDVLLVPGGKGRREAMGDPRVLDFVRSRAAGLRYLASVCTGAFILAEAGLLDGRQVTTHHAALDELRHYPVRVKIAKVVQDGHLLSAAGVSSGLELGFCLLKLLFGSQLAAQVARGIEYNVDLTCYN